MKRWTIVTVSYNSGEDLQRFWSGGIPSEVEWIVVDNASGDRSVQVAEDLGAKVIAQPHNGGFSQACNVGLREAQGEYIAFVNPDVQIDFSTLPAIEATIDEEEALVAPQLVYEDGSLQPNGRGLPTLWNKVANRIAPPDGANRYYRLAQRGEVPCVCWVIGAAVSGRRGTFERLGGWDDVFFIYYEDSDLGMRAWSAGIPVKLLGDANWTHGWARETTTFKFGPWKHELRSMFKFYRRYPSLLLPITDHCYDRLSKRTQ